VGNSPNPWVAADQFGHFEIQLGPGQYRRCNGHRGGFGQQGRDSNRLRARCRHPRARCRCQGAASGRPQLAGLHEVGIFAVVFDPLVQLRLVGTFDGAGIDLHGMPAVTQPAKGAALLHLMLDRDLATR